MEIIIRDNNLVPVAILDKFESFIWTDRYTELGDFEIYTPMGLSINEFLIADYHLQLKGSDRLMVIEKFDIKGNPKEGNKLVVTGRGIESILERRIVWDQTIFTDANLQTSLQSILNDNAINPTDTDRDLPFTFLSSTDPTITALTIDMQTMGEELLEVVIAIAQTYGLGFKITIDEDDLLEFQLYVGADRSYGQSTNSYVIFSPKFDNVLETDYTFTKEHLKTIARIVGEGEGSNRLTTTQAISGGAGTGLARREMFVDAGDISKTYSGGTLSDADYIEQLKQKGAVELSYNFYEHKFEGKVDTTQLFKYGVDFFLGDIVQRVDEYGHENAAQVTEITFSESASGIDIYPTFEAIE